jgi:hypothetical protein
MNPGRGVDRHPSFRHRPAIWQAALASGQEEGGPASDETLDPPLPNDRLKV